MLNDGRVHLKNRGPWIEQLNLSTLDIIALHLAYTFFLSGHYMVSSAYIDALEVGMTPEYGSEDWVAPYVQSFLTDGIERAVPGTHCCAARGNGDGTGRVSIRTELQRRS